jgi:hypothetical protein
MRVFRLASVFLFSLLLGGQVLPLPGHATHPKPCCGCGTCKATCTCPGTNYHCPYCRMGDADTVQAHGLPDNETLDIRAVHKLLRSPVTTPDTERFMELAMGKKCILGNFRLKLLDSIEDSLKFESVRFDEEGIQDNTVAFHITADAER